MSLESSSPWGLLPFSFISRACSIPFMAASAPVEAGKKLVAPDADFDKILEDMARAEWNFFKFIFLEANFKGPTRGQGVRCYVADL